ncbi:MAG: hypothetical protein VXA38_04070, partial [Aquiluna sp.]
DQPVVHAAITDALAQDVQHALLLDLKDDLVNDLGLDRCPVVALEPGPLVRLGIPEVVQQYAGAQGPFHVPVGLRAQLVVAGIDQGLAQAALEGGLVEFSHTFYA